MSQAIIANCVAQYTKRANPNRGYHDSEDVVTFEPGSTEAEQLEMMESIRAGRAKDNMWAYAPKKVSENVWSVNYGYDSGD